MPNNTRVISGHRILIENTLSSSCNNCNEEIRCRHKDILKLPEKFYNNDLIPLNSGRQLSVYSFATNTPVIGRISDKCTLLKKEVEAFWNIFSPSRLRNTAVPKIIFPVKCKEGRSDEPDIDYFINDNCKPLVIYTHMEHVHHTNRLKPLSEVTEKVSLHDHKDMIRKIQNLLNSINKAHLNSGNKSLINIVEFYNNKRVFSPIFEIQYCSSSEDDVDNWHHIRDLCEEFAYANLSGANDKYWFCNIEKLDYPSGEANENGYICEYKEIKARVVIHDIEPGQIDSVIQEGFAGEIISARFDFTENRREEVFNNSHIDYKKLGLNDEGLPDVSSDEFLPYLLSPVDTFSDIMKQALDMSGNTRVLYWPDDGKPEFRGGVIHGDLHSGNILVEEDSDSISFSSVIDWELADKDSILAHDFARLEVDLLLHELIRIYEQENDFELNPYIIVDLFMERFLSDLCNTTLDTKNLQLKPFSNILFSIGRAIIPDGEKDSEVRLKILLEHMWCGFFNSMMFFFYKEKDETARPLFAWLLAIVYGSIAHNPWIYIKREFEWVSRFRRSNLRNKQVVYDDFTSYNYFGVFSEIDYLDYLEDDFNKYYKLVQDGFERIARVFVPMSAVAGIKELTDYIAIEAQGNSGKNYLDRIVEDNSKVVLLGDPGSGKSFCGLKILQKAKFGETRQDRKIPIFISLPIVTKRIKAIEEEFKNKINELSNIPEFEKLSKLISDMVIDIKEKKQEDNSESGKKLYDYKYYIDLLSSFKLEDRLADICKNLDTAKNDLSEVYEQLSKCSFKELRVVILYRFLNRMFLYRLFQSFKDTMEYTLKREGKHSDEDTKEFLSLLTNDFPNKLINIWLFGRMVLILDSLNEVTSGSIEMIKNKIKTLLKPSPGNIIVCSRKHGYEEGSLGIKEFTLLPFDEDKFKEFVTKWCEDKTRLQENERSEYAKKLYTAFNHPNISESSRMFSKNPLNLYLILNVTDPKEFLGGDDRQKNKIPNRSVLFSKYIHKHMENVESDENRQSISKQLGLIAFNMVENGNTTSISIDDAKKYIGMDENDNFKELEDFAKKPGVILLDENTFRFYHQSIQEYFAAQHLWFLGSKEKFIKKFKLKRWDESIHIMVLFKSEDSIQPEVNPFEVMVEEKYYDLLIDCLNQAESLDWGVIDSLVLSQLREKNLSIAMRQELVKYFSELNHPMIPAKEVLHVLVKLLDDDNYEDIWITLIDCILILLQKEQDDPIKLKLVLKLEELLSVNASLEIRQNLLSYLLEDINDNLKSTIFNVRIKLIEIIKNSEFSYEQAVMALTALHKAEVPPPPDDSEVQIIVDRFINSEDLTAIDMALNWCESYKPDVELLNIWLNNEWLELVSKYGKRLDNLKSLAVEKGLFFEFYENWWLKKADDKEKLKLKHLLGYLELLGERAEFAIPDTLKLALLSSKPYEKEIVNYLKKLKELTLANASELLGLLTTPVEKLSFEQLLNDALDDFNTNNPMANAAAFLIGTIELDDKQRQVLISKIKELGNSWIKDEGVSEYPWVCLFALIRYHKLGELLTDMREWGWAVYIQCRNETLNYIFRGRFLKIFWHAFLRAVIAASAEDEACTDVARWFVWTENVSEKKLYEWPSHHFSLYGARKAVDLLIASANDSTNVRDLEVCVIFGLIIDSVFYERVFSIVTFIEKQNTWLAHIVSMEYALDVCYFGLALNDKYEDFHSLVDCMVKQERYNNSFSLYQTTNNFDKFSFIKSIIIRISNTLSSWKPGNPPGLNTKLRNALSKESKSIIIQKIKELGFGSNSKNYCYGIANLDMVSKDDLPVLLKGTKSDDKNYEGICYKGISSWATAIKDNADLIVDTMKPFLEELFLEGETESRSICIVFKILQDFIDNKVLAALKLLDKVVLLGSQGATPYILFVLKYGKLEEKCPREALEAFLKQTLEYKDGPEAYDAIRKVGERLKEFIVDDYDEEIQKRALKLKVFCGELIKERI